MPSARFVRLSRFQPAFSAAVLASIAISGLLSCSPAALAQGSPVAPRIAAEADDAHRTTLSGNVPLLARTLAGTPSDLGEAAPATRMTHVRLVLSRSPEQEAALDKYMAELQDKSSPNYHKWLTPQQFGQLYGPADSDIAAIVAWIESRGLNLEQVSAGRTNIAFSGTVSQVEEAFHTQIHSFEASIHGKTTQFYSNTSDPSIPAALAPVVQGVAHLDTLRPVPAHTAGPAGRFDPEARRVVPVNAADAKGLPASLRPNLTTGSGTSSDPYFLYIVPGDAATVYDTPNTTFNANYTSGTSYTGAGVTIGIGGDAAIQTATVVNYRTLFLGNSTAPTVSNVDGVTSTDDADEAYIDTQLSGGLAPGAAIHYYTSTDLYSAVDQAISDNTVDIFSLSFGYCELGFTTAENAEFNSGWQQASSQGIAVVVATGDTGSASCDAGDSSGTTEAQYGLSVSGLASTPYNIAAGGTDLYGLNSSFSQYVSLNESTSANYFRTALSYIPESTWNDSSEFDTTIGANVPWTAVAGESSVANITAGSGGRSSCSTNTGTDSSTGACTSGYPKPSWQRGAGVPADGVRDLPDISLMAGNGFDPATWLVCTDATYSSGGATYTENCAVDASGNFSAAGYGGTSTAAPAFAGMLALVQQKTGSRLGQAAQELYNLFNGAHASVIFHDTTVGNNSVPCVSGTPDCVANSGGYYFESGYNTTAGYDLATGLGSVDVKQMVAYWDSSTGSAKATVTVTPSATTVASTASFTVAVTVSGGSATPTGTVTLTSGGYTSSAETLSGGSFTFHVAASDLAIGADTLTVAYSGDSSYASTTGAASVTVTAPGAAVSPSSLTFGATLVGSSTAAQTVTLKNTGDSTLTLQEFTLTGAGFSSYSVQTSCLSTLAAGDSCHYLVTFTPLAAGTLTATLGIVDSDATSPQTVSLTGTGVTPTPAISLSPASLTFASTTQGSSAAAQTVAIKNTGTAALTIGGISIAGANASSYSQTNTCGTGLAIGASCAATVTFTPTTFGTLTASLSIADNAPGSPQTVSLSGTGTEAGSYTLAAAAVTVAPGATGTSAITATGKSGYAGPNTITLNSCTLATSPSGATALPTCAITGATVTFAAGATTGSGGSIAIDTTAASTSAVKSAPLSAQGHAGRWAGAGAVAVAGLLLFGIPARRRRWRSLLSVLLFAAAFGILSGCGGGSGGGGTTIPGTSAGAYTFTLTGTDADGVQQKVIVNVTVS